MIATFYMPLLLCSLMCFQSTDSTKSQSLEMATSTGSSFEIPCRLQAKEDYLFWGR